MQPSLIQDISDDLKISSCLGESRELWHCRLIYSAMALWLKTMVLDTSSPIAFEESEIPIGGTEKFEPLVTCVHRRHLRHRGTQILEEMLRYFSPKVRNWFMESYEKESNKQKRRKLHPIWILCERMLHSGELTGWIRRKIALPEPKYVAITPLVNRFYGLSMLQADSRICSGLAWIKCHFDKPEKTFEETSESIESTEAMPESIHEVSRYIRSVPKWESLSLGETELEYSDPYSKNIPSKSWNRLHIQRFLNEYGTLPFCVWRRPSEHSYGLLRCRNRNIVYMKFSDYQRNCLEYRRFIHVLRAKVGNPIQARLTMFDTCFQLHLQASLPKREESILLGLGWPQRSITDQHHLIFPWQLAPYIKRLLQQLNIQIQDGK